ncbi:orotate phosphoribosyltransferase [Paenibacillus doosanensis]|uniref:orotate phosphoribosyltransferase n=1 Tax=Paenibacillus doosanensis TaxID=1229154 RepID=UPI002180007B|nr:orotate phosphoribosyltransferase [Paenibacillus doosanensis]MCS7464906.1 orotate phosphoribosyltransferase [Paenibacillus doosanensis]
MEKNKLAEAMVEAAYVTGTFRLRSGRTADHYFDKFQFESDPKLLSVIAEQLAAMIPAGTEVLAGLELGGVPIAAALSLRTGLPAAFVRKAAKDYGTCKLAEGAAVQGKNVCIIEDVVTTGGQILLSRSDLAALGAEVKHVLCVIERDLQGRINLGNEGLELRSLFRMEELPLPNAR